MTEPTPSPSSDEDAVKVVSDALMVEAIGGPDVQAQPPENFPFARSLCDEKARAAVAALRRAGLMTSDPIANAVYDVLRRERDEARSLLRDLEEAATNRFSGQVGHPKASDDLHAALAAVSRARKEQGWQ